MVLSFYFYIFKNMTFTLTFIQRIDSSNPSAGSRTKREITKSFEDLSAKTKRPKTFLIKEMFEEHLAEYQHKYLTLERLHYAEEAERILELYGEVPLYSQNL